MQISLVICTYNPRIDFLERTLDSIRKQTLDQSQWELLVIDNASDRPVSDQVEIDWHKCGRILVERDPGLIKARLRAFRETTSQLIVFSDDDNELAPDYLENAWNLYQSFPQLGAFGACIDCEYEQPVEAPVDHIDVFRDPNGGRGTIWSNDPWHECSNPIGAGLSLRREVASSYLERVKSDSGRLMFGRTGSQLLSFEDTDIVHHATEIGFGKGIFSELRLLHLIGSNRTTKDYLLRLVEGHSYSKTHFLELKGKTSSESGLIRRLKRFAARLGVNGFAKEIFDASLRGERRAKSAIARDQT